MVNLSILEATVQVHSHSRTRATRHKPYSYQMGYPFSPGNPLMGSFEILARRKIIDLRSKALRIWTY